MNIACTACPARYGVADEKITGKRVRITCKRCGTVLVIDGTVSPAQVTASTSIAPGPPARAASSAPPPPPVTPPTEPFLVAFADEHQEHADVAQIVRLHRSGKLGADSLVWREGMANWQSPWDVEEIAAAFRRMGYSRPTPQPAFGGARTAATAATRDTARRSRTPRLASVDDDETTSVVDSSPVAAERPGSRRPAPEPASSPVREDDEVPTHVARPAARSSNPPATTARTARSERPQQRTSHPATQRGSDRPNRTSSERPYQRPSDRLERPSTRPATTPKQARNEPARRRESTRPGHSPTAERFARQAYAGAEDDDEEARQRVAAVEAQGALMDATDDGQRLTGARNETSVLFSLDSLLKQERAPERPPQPVNSRFEESLLVDANPALPAGGSFVPGLSAPDFTAPVTAPPPQFAPATVEPVVYPREDSSKKWMLMTAAVVVLSGIGFAWMSGALNPVLSKVGLGPAPSAAPAPARPPEPIPSATSAPAESAAPEASAAPSASAEPAASASASAAATAVARAPAAATPVQRSPSTRETPSPSPATPRATPDSEPESAAEPAPAPAPAPAGGGGDFDASAAKTALTAAAGNASSCKEAGGPTGNGRVSITFAPSGRPTSVAVTGDLAGTTVGSCVARLFRQTRVPSFSGEPVTVAKGFSVE